MKNYLKILLICTLPILAGCKKSFLQAKPDDSLVVPSTLAELRAILDNDTYINGSNSFGADPHLGDQGTDDYYLTDEDYLNNTDDYHRAAYTWADQIPFPAASKNWIGPYRVIFYANIVLDGLKKITPAPSELDEYQNLRGCALFLRAYQFYNLAQVFAPPYNAATAETDLGIPLRLSADVSEKSFRATLGQTYTQILNDLRESIRLLPDLAAFKTRGGKSAAYALLSRIYLTMQQYEASRTNAALSLSLQGELIDYNDVSASDPRPFKLFNKEVIFLSSISEDFPNLIPDYAKIADDLYESYPENDLRKKLFFSSQDQYQIFKGSYNGNSIPFTGLATDEIFLNLAEAHARLGDGAQARAVLNQFLQKRIDKASFEPVELSAPEQLLGLILDQRRKQLLFRNTRWTDLRRLNIDPRFARTLSRTVNGSVYTLPPNDLKYTWPIPSDVLGLANLIQNPR
ncbi:MAG TPA: RagB/SusD family nutrient uptake outer membrane protein [Pedobacter sp.]|nr:RagB/SusD family nutrient uptake outer membrane protein [Pedobacter sp.]